MCDCADRPKRLDYIALDEYGLAVDHRGIVRWLGVDWRGLPFPLRVWTCLRIAVRRARAGELFDVTQAIELFAGCGCIDRLKRLAERFA